jgi:hypothetical protein
MTRDEIIRMARQAGIEQTGPWFSCVDEELERFAHLVAAHEREECADIARKVGTKSEPEDFALDMCYEIEAAIRNRGNECSLDQKT